MEPMAQEPIGLLCLGKEAYLWIRRTPPPPPAQASTPSEHPLTLVARPNAERLLLKGSISAWESFGVSCGITSRYTGYGRMHEQGDVADLPDRKYLVEVRVSPTFILSR